MHSVQEHSLRLLELLLSDSGVGRQSRGTALLACQGIREGYARIPEEEAFCPGWAYTMGQHFANALDMRLDRRMRNKKPYHIWTQGSAFHFREGYSVTRTDGGAALQIQAAKAAVPARDGEPRDPGFARIQLYEPGDMPGTWNKAALRDRTQDELVRMLITGAKD